MATRRVNGWEGADGKLYVLGDEAVGMGNPPSDPVWQAANPGAGRYPMRQVAVDLEVDAEGAEIGRTLAV